MNPPTPPIEFDLGPIIYFYTHSLLIIALSAVVFMALGVWIGWLTWARFKRRARAYQEECDLLRHEIAALKRRIGEDTVGPAPLVLINEDAPVPPKIDDGPALPGFDTPGPKAGALPAVHSVAAVEMQPVIVIPAPVERHAESLAAVVIGPKGAAHHTHEPAAPPDAIAELSTAPAAPEPLPVPVTVPVTETPPAASDVTAPAMAEPAAAPEADAVHQEAAPAINGAAAAPAPVVARQGVHPIAELLPGLVLLPGTNGTQAAAEQAPPEAPAAPPAKPGRSAPASAETVPLAMHASSAFAEELASGVAVEDSRLGILLRFQPDRWDDLTLLRGVGEVLQQRLHDCGVHTFKQIAYWTEDNVEEFSTKIEARDRIRREHWVNQARDMHFLKYGEKLG